MKTVVRSPKQRTQRSGANGKAKKGTRVLFPQARFLTRPERLALNAYKNYLLRRFPDRLERIILYGSKARGDGQMESDLDVLVVINGDMPEKYPFDKGEGLWSQIVSPRPDPYQRYGVFLSPLLMNTEETNKWKPLLANIRRDGIELWRRRGIRGPILPEGGWEALPMHKDEEVKARIAIADDKLIVARDMYEKGHYNDTISKAYYAMFYAGKALLLQLGIDPHKHTGLVNLYGDKLVRVGLSDPKYGEALKHAMKERLDADYRVGFHATQEQAAESIRSAEEFIGEAKQTLKRLREQVKQNEPRQDA